MDRRYIRFHERRHPADLDERGVSVYLSALAVELGVSPATQNQALAALLFLYKDVVRRPLRRIEGIIPARSSSRIPVVCRKTRSDQFSVSYRSQRICA